MTATVQLKAMIQFVEVTTLNISPLVMEDALRATKKMVMWYEKLLTYFILKIGTETLETVCIELSVVQ